MSELKQKIRESLQDPQLVSLATVTKEGRPWVRYVMAFGDEDLTIRFVTGMDSRKVAHIKENPEVHITLGAVSLMETERYMQIAGRA